MLLRWSTGDRSVRPIKTSSRLARQTGRITLLRGEPLEDRCVPAAVYTWNSDVEANSDVPGNWRVNGNIPQAPPGPDDTLVFTAAHKGDCVMMTPKVAGIEMQAGYTGNGTDDKGTLILAVKQPNDFDYTLEVTGSFSMADGYVSNAGDPNTQGVVATGDLRITGADSKFTWTLGQIWRTNIILGSSTNHAVTGKIAGNVDLNRSTLDNYGNFTWTSGTINVGAGGGFIHNNAGASFEVVNGAAFTGAALTSRSFTNQGLFEFTGTGQLDMKADFENKGGTARIYGGTLAFYGIAEQTGDGTFDLRTSWVKLVNSGSALGIRDGTITGVALIEGNLVIGYEDGTPSSPIVRPGIDDEIGTLYVTQSFRILSKDTRSFFRIGANGANSMIRVQDGGAVLDGYAGFEMTTTNPPDKVIYKLVDVMKAQQTLAGTFIDRPEGSNVNLVGVKFKFSYTKTGNDAVIYPLAKVDGNAWHDKNFDGIQNDGPDQFAMAGFTVKLYDAESNDLLAQTTTDEGGNYTFDDLDDGGYYLEFVPLDNWRITFQDMGSDDALDSDPDRNTRKTAPFTLNPGEDDTTRDAGMYQLAAVGDYVWCDGPNDPRIPHNGIQDNGEPGLAGLSVLLFDGAGNYLTGTTTDSAGHYEFRYLEPGLYEVRVVLPSPTPSGSYVFTIRYAGDDPTIDSNADASGSSGVFALKEGETDWTIDFGILGPPPDPNPGGEGPTLVGTVESYAVMTSGGSGSDPIAPAESGRSATAASAPAAAGGGEPAAKPTGTAVGQASISVAPDFSEWSDFVIDLGAHPRRHPVIAAQATGFRS